MSNLIRHELGTIGGRLSAAQELVNEVLRDVWDMEPERVIVKDVRLDEATGELAAVIDLLQKQNEEKI